MTITGVILIPLALVLSFLPWRFMLMALPSFALLHGAAVVNFGSVGLQPGYALALLVIMRTGLEILMLREPLNRDALVYTAPLGVLVVISMLVLWVSVCFFTGKITVIGGTDAYILENARPYDFRRENMAQMVYLLINTVLVYVLAHQSARFSPAELLRLIDKSISAAAVIALGICGWQMLAHVAGIYFPTDFLFTNAGYFRADNQAFFGSLRLNGPFSEPSFLAYYFSGFLLYSWKRLRLQPSLLWMTLVIGLTGAIFLAYSTTGYIVLSVFVGIVGLDLLPSVGRVRMLRLTWQKVAIVALLLLATGSAMLWVAHNWDYLGRILDVSLLNKERSSSFAQRSGAEAMAIDIIAQTGGIGVGLGSHKANSLFLTLLSNVGVLGTIAFLFFLVLVLRPAEAKSLTGNRAVTLTETPLRFLVVGLLLGHAISNPNFNAAMFWMMSGLLAGYHASIRQATSATGFITAGEAPVIRQALGSSQYLTRSSAE